MKRANTMADVLEDFTDDAQLRKRREKERKSIRRRGTSDLKEGHTLFDGKDDSEAAITAAEADMLAHYEGGRRSRRPRCR